MGGRKSEVGFSKKAEVVRIGVVILKTPRTHIGRKEVHYLLTNKIRNRGECTAIT